MIPTTMAQIKDKNFKMNFGDHLFLWCGAVISLGLFYLGLFFFFGGGFITSLVVCVTIIFCWIFWMYVENKLKALTKQIPKPDFIKVINAGYFLIMVVSGVISAIISFWNTSLSDKLLTIAGYSFVILSANFIMIALIQALWGRDKEK